MDITISPLFLILLSLPEIFVLWKVFRNTLNPYVFAALIKVLIFCFGYIYIGFTDPPIEQARVVLRELFILMQTIGAVASLIYLNSEKR